MTGSVTRIRWQDTPVGTISGHVGTVEQEVFAIWKPPQASGEWVLESEIPGLSAARCYSDTPDTLKAEAERWLERFISSLGAAFPEEPGESAAFQLGEARAVLARWDAEQGGEFVISREKVLADQVRALLAIVDQEAAVKAGED